LVFVILVCLVAGLREPRFLEASSINSILLWMPLLTVAAMGELLVIVIRGIDVSIGSILGFCGIAVGMVYRAHSGLPVWLGLGLGATIGLGLGCLNAALVFWGRLSPVIVTIGTLSAFRGAAFLLSHGDQIDSSMIPDSLTNLASQGIHLGAVTVSALLLISLAVGVGTAGFLLFTQTGRDIFAFGSNPNAARLRGISPTTVIFVAYGFCGATAGLAGVMYAARFGFVNPGTAGQSFELNVIAAVAIGGVRITGGYGSVGGVLLGCLLLSCINVALSVASIAADWQLLAYGILILIALLADSVLRLRKGVVA
jgi:rhamnose transport system permease protein